MNKKNLSYQEAAEFSAKEFLGTSFFGSKSDYREKHPSSNPVFNGTLMLQQPETGELLKIWHGDLDLNNESTKTNLKLLAKKFNSFLYLYRESTVHNHIFNQRRFPYEYQDFLIDALNIVPKNE